MSAAQLVRHDGWSEVRLSNPKRRNALSQASVEEILQALQDAAAGAEVVLLSATGPVFCAGADTSESHRPSQAPSTRLLDELASLEAHVVAAVEGPAIGAGVALLALCPTVVADPSAWFSLPEASLGRFGAGPAPHLETVLPARVVHDLALTGRRMASEEAASHGLVTRLSGSGAARADAAEAVQALVAAPTVARQGRWWWQQRFASSAFLELRRSALAVLDRDYAVADPDAQEGQA
jgi:enoyl-CoA hydratase/carnithine racemase